MLWIFIVYALFFLYIYLKFSYHKFVFLLLLWLIKILNFNLRFYISYTLTIHSRCVLYLLLSFFFTHNTIEFISNNWLLFLHIAPLNSYPITDLEKYVNHCRIKYRTYYVEFHHGKVSIHFISTECIWLYLSISHW